MRNRHTTFGLAGLAAVGIAAAGLGAAASSASAPRASGPPKSIAGAPIPPDRAPYAKPGTRLRQAALGIRVFTDAKHGFALGGVTAGGGAQYPAATVDGGRTWRIDGPHFHVNAADAPDVVAEVGAGRRGVYFAYAGPYGGQAIDVTSDGGRHWWRAFLPTPPVAVVYNPFTHSGELIAFLQGHPTWVYVSKDGGRHWTLSTDPNT